MDIIVLQTIAPNNEPSWRGGRSLTFQKNEYMVIGLDRLIYYYAVKFPSSLL